MVKKFNLKIFISIVVLAIIALISIFALSPIASSTEFHAKSIQALDDKKITVMELTGATAGASTALALIPTDATTPLANQIAELSSYLLIIVGAIFLEKILLTLTGKIAFTFLIPLACLLYGIYLFIKKDILKNLAIKLGIFGIVIFMVVPVSIQVSNLIENTYQSSINQTIEDAKDVDLIVEETTSDESKDNESWWSTITSKVTDGISNIGDTVSGWIEKGKKMLSNFIDAIAVLLITSCVIPIVVLLSFIWIIKLIFDINISSANVKKMKVNNHLKKQQSDNPVEASTANSKLNN